jgi:hypothetical protein
VRNLRGQPTSALSATMRRNAVPALSAAIRRQENQKGPYGLHFGLALRRGGEAARTDIETSIFGFMATSGGGAAER